MRLDGFALLATRRLAADPVLAALAGLLLASAVTLPATGALYAERVALAGLRATFVAAAPEDRSVRVAIDAPVAELRQLDPAVTGEVARTIGWTSAATGASAAPVSATRFAGVVRVLHSGGFTIRAAAPGSPAAQGAASGDLLVLASFDDLASHASVVDGEWPRSGSNPVEAALSAPAATALGLRTGDTVDLADPQDAARTLTVHVSGTWQADPGDPYWESEPLDIAGSETARLTSRGPFVLDRADFLSVLAGAGAHAEWRAFPDPTTLDGPTSSTLSDAVGGLRGRLQAIVGHDRGVDVATGMPALLSRLAAAGVVSRQTILLLVVELGVLALMALLLVGGIVAASRRREEMLLRERGARTLDLIGAAFAEALLLGIPAVVVAVLASGPLSTWLVERTVGAAPGVPSGVDPSVVPLAIGCVVAGAIALAAPSLRPGRSLVSLRTAIGRRVGRTFAQRIGLDTILLALGVIGVWELRAYGGAVAGASSDPTVIANRGVDPVLVLAPTLGLVAGTAIVTRGIPRLAELLERALDRPRGLIAPLWGREVSRRPQRASRIALLVVLASGLGTLAVTHAATWARSQEDQAAYQVPADVLVTPGPARAIPPWLQSTAYASLPGVESASAILDQPVPTGPAVGARLLAVDAAWLDQLAARPGSPASLRGLHPALASLSDGLPPDQAVAIPDGTVRLRVTVDSQERLLGPDAQGNPRDVTGAVPLPGTDIAVVIRDGSGRFSRLSVGTASQGSANVDVDLARAAGGRTIAPGPGLRLVGLELSFPAPGGLFVSGRVEVTHVLMSARSSGDSWTELPVAPGSSGWAWQRIESPSAARGTGTLSYTPPADGWGRIVLGSNIGSTSADAPVANGPIPTRFVLQPPQPAAASVAVPALVDDRLLASIGATVGDTIDGSFLGEGLRIRIVGSSELFPTLDPARSFLVVDRRWSDLARWASGGDSMDPGGWWLTTPTGTIDPSLTEALLAAPFEARSVLTRSSVQSGLLDDPISLGTIGALALGAMACVIFSVIGYLAHAATATEEASTELALLRALGTSRRQILAWLWATYAALLAFSVVAGALLGLLLAWLIVPTATLTATGHAPIPPPSIVIPPELVLGLSGVAAALLLVTVPIVRHRVGRLDLGAILRTEAAGT